MHREADLAADDDHMVHRLTLSKLSNLANFGCLSWGRVTRWWKVLSIWLQFPTDENLPQFGPSWPAMTQIKNQRLERCRNPVLSLTQFFSFHLIENTDRLLLRGKPKSRGEQILLQFQQKKEPIVVQFMFGENKRSRRESQCECRLLFLGLKRTELLMLSYNMDSSSDLDNFNFLVCNNGRALLTWRRLIYSLNEEK